MPMSPVETVPDGSPPDRRAFPGWGLTEGMKCKNLDILMDLGLQYLTAVWYIQLSALARQDQKKIPY